MAKSGHYVTQRVANVKEEIKQTYLSGQQVVIPAIAEAHHVSESYPYKLLEEIAKELGITREDLLRYPKSTFTKSSPLLTKPEKADVNKLLKTLDQTLQDIESLMSEVKEVLKNE